MVPMARALVKLAERHELRRHTFGVVVQKGACLLDDDVFRNDAAFRERHEMFSSLSSCRWHSILLCLDNIGQCGFCCFLRSNFPSACTPFYMYKFTFSDVEPERFH